MPRKKQAVKKSAYIQVSIEPEDKDLFDWWCQNNGTTMSDVIRREIAPYISKARILKNGED